MAIQNPTVLDVREDGVSVEALTTILDFTDTDAVAITNPAAGTASPQLNLYALLGGRAGGQTLIGGSAASENLTLQSTSDATRGEIRLLDDTDISKHLAVGGSASIDANKLAVISETIATSADEKRGLELTPNFASSANAAHQRGLVVEMTDSSTANHTLDEVIKANLIYNNANILSTANIIEVNADIQAGTITTMNLVQIGNPTLTGTVINLVGLRIAPISGASTLNFAIGSDGGPSYHVGNFRIGSSVVPTVALDVTGGIQFSGICEAPDGTSGAPSYTFSSDETMGLFSPSANTISFAFVGLEITRFSVFGEAQIQFIDFGGNIQPSRSTAAAGDDLFLRGGNGLGGTNAGGDVQIRAGIAAGGGTDGVVTIINASNIIQIEVNSTGIGLYAVAPVARSPAWVITNDVTDRTFDANAGSVTELADVVATLIKDLAATGIVGAAP